MFVFYLHLYSVDTLISFQFDSPMKTTNYHAVGRVKNLISKRSNKESRSVTLTHKYMTCALSWHDADTSTLNHLVVLMTFARSYYIYRYIYFIKMDTWYKWNCHPCFYKGFVKITSNRMRYNTCKLISSSKLVAVINF